MVKTTKLYLALIVIIALITLISANDNIESLGTFKQNDCINLKQICSNCTYNNITSVIDQSSTKILSEVIMTKNGTEYNYTFCKTYSSGNWIVCGKGDPDGTNTVWCYNFTISPSGYSNLLGFYIIILAIGFGIIIFGFWIRDGWVTIFGTLGLYLVGIFILLFGIDGLRNLTITRGLSFIILGMASYISIRSGIEMMD